MKSGYVGSSGTINMDVSKLVEALEKNASKINQQPANSAKKTLSVKTMQDVIKETKKITGGENAGKLGKENPPKAASPKIPTGKALLGKEVAVKVNDPKVPMTSEGDLIGGEKDNGALKGINENITGGTSGQGTSGEAHKKASVSESEKIDHLYEMLMKNMNKNAGKMEVTEVVEQKISGGENAGALGEEKPAKATKLDRKGLEHGDSLIGDEKTLKPIPSGKDTPTIPTDDKRMGGEKDNEKIKPSRGNDLNGVVLAASQLDKKVKSEAIRIAGRMLENRRIGSEQLPAKIAELETYKLPQLKDIEVAMFLEKKAGSDTNADGLTTPVVIGTSASMDAKEELSKQIAGLFSLNKQNEYARETNEDLKKSFR
jgi:hypothetical protein